MLGYSYASHLQILHFEYTLTVRLFEGSPGAWIIVLTVSLTVCHWICLFVTEVVRLSLTFLFLMLDLSAWLFFYVFLNFTELNFAEFACHWIHFNVSVCRWIFVSITELISLLLIDCLFVTKFICLPLKLAVCYGIFLFVTGIVCLSLN